MRLFGRDLRENLGEARRLPLYLWYFVKIAIVFHRPLEFIRSYIGLRSPAGNAVKTRDGLTILLSGHPHDIITVFVIFIREDYGRAPRGRVVVDVGANIGVFTLWAIRCGASRVLAFEPSATTFAHLRRNVEANGLQDVVSTFREAVHDTDGASVPFPREGTMYSSIGEGEEGEHDMVRTVTLNTIVQRAGDRVGLLKLDCEGAEYAALAAVDAASLARIDAVKLEYHAGRVQTLIETFEKQSFRVSLLKPANETLGNLWVVRA